MTLAVASYTQSTPAASLTHTVTKPTGTVDGELLIVCGSSDPDGASSTNLTPPGGGGWTSVHSGGAGPSPAPGQAGYFRVWTRVASSEGASWTFGSTLAADSQFTALRVTGATGATVTAVASGGTTATLTAHLAPSLAGVTGDLLICGWQIVPEASASTYVAQVSMSQHGTASSVSGTWLRHVVASELLVATGATGTRTMTTSLTPANFGNTTWSLVLTAPAVVVPTVTTGFVVAVDWDKNGTFTSVGDDVSNRVRGSIQAEFGRDQSTSLSPMIAGRGGFNLDNSSRAYSPRNTASPLYGKVKPARPVKVSRVIGGTEYTIFSGHTDDSPINPDVDSKQVTLTLVDWLADFRGQTISTPLYSGYRTGAIIDIILTAAGWTGGRDLDTGATVFPYWWADGSDVFDMLTAVLASEGPPALLTIGSAGEIVFRDRHHRLLRTASTTVQSTWRASGTAEPVLSKGFTYDDNWRNIVNSVAISVNERQPTGLPAEVWSTEETIFLAASASRTIVISVSEPFFGAVTPVTGTDYTITAGALASVSLSRTSGASTSVTITATGAGCTVQGMILRAISVPVVRTVQVTASNSTSIAAYGQRGLPSNLEPTWASKEDVEDIADLYVLQRAEPLPLVNARFICVGPQTTRLAALLALDLSDRVSVTEAETGLTAVAFFIESISHVTDGHTHEITFGLEAVPTSPTSVFIVGTSLLNGADPLGY